MPAYYPLGVAEDDQILFNRQTQIWERGVAGEGSCCNGVLLTTPVPTPMIFDGTSSSQTVKVIGFDLANMDATDFRFVKDEATGPTLRVDTVTLTEAVSDEAQTILVNFTDISVGQITGRTYCVATQPCGCQTLLFAVDVETP